MVDREFIADASYTNNRNEDFLLKYYMLISSGSTGSAYGVSVEKYIVNGRSSQLKDEDSILKVTHNYREISNIINRLARGLVTPMNLAEIVDELI